MTAKKPSTIDRLANSALASVLSRLSMMIVLPLLALLWTSLQTSITDSRDIAIDARNNAAAAIATGLTLNGNINTLAATVEGAIEAMDQRNEGQDGLNDARFGALTDRLDRLDGRIESLEDRASIAPF